MITIRRAGERGSFNHGWLDTRHTFSFAGYYDPRFMGFRSLRVINEDFVEPGRGFGTHGHQDMEIVTYIVQGALEHKDSLGTGSIIRPGEVQRMTAGTGVRHSEFNPSRDERVHLLQIWIMPEKNGLTPSYEQKEFPIQTERGKFHKIASGSPNGDSAITIHQDAHIFAGVFDDRQTAQYTLGSGRAAWIQVVKGAVEVNGNKLEAGDGAAVEGIDQLTFQSDGTSELLMFDLV